MDLSLEQIKQITTGAVRITEDSNGFCFYRFTEEQEELYKVTNENFYNRSFSTAGIKLLFKTDSKNLFVKFKAIYSTPRTYFSVDVFVNKTPVGYIDNFSNVEFETVYPKQKFELGEFSGKFELGDGEKEVCIHLPWSVQTVIEEISLDDNSFIEGIKPKKKYMAYGDSITHGHDALRPSNRYVAKLADSLGAEEYNKGIGGAMFLDELAALKDSFVPDYITVAYGSNDWNHVDTETFKSNCRGFYANLAKNYPDTKIFAISPIWRKIYKEPRALGAFEDVEKYIAEVVKDYENIVLIPGFDLVPHSSEYFADLTLHPNDEGFSHYYENIYNEIKKYI
ncbi:MAG: SGNH/GDSL hydrolase family protein [Clostridia bacterium]|nr:SGNH/GDSL hydrolase family protein [Clostridia bacterium]